MYRVGSTPEWLICALSAIPAFSEPAVRIRRSALSGRCRQRVVGSASAARRWRVGGASAAPGSVHGRGFVRYPVVRLPTSAEDRLALTDRLWPRWRRRWPGRGRPVSGRNEHQPVDTRLGELRGLPGSHPAAGRDADLQLAKPGLPLDSIRGSAKAGERGGSAGGREPVPVPAVSARDRPAIRRRAVAPATSGIGCWSGRGRASMPAKRPWYSGCWSYPPEDCDRGMCTPSWARRRGVLRAGGPLRERWRAGRCTRAGLAARSGLHS